MTKQEDILSPEASRAKIRSVQKGTLFQTLTAVFSMQDLYGGFNGKGSEQAFYEGLGENIRKDYKKLNCLEDYAAHAEIDIFSQNAEQRVITAIENRAGQFWANLMRYQTIVEMKQCFTESELAYKNLMQNGKDSFCPLSGEDKHNIPSIETIITVHHMSLKVAEMLRVIEPSFQL